VIEGEFSGPTPGQKKKLPSDLVTTYSFGVQILIGMFDCTQNCSIAKY
jgi:hypothetical protein